MFKQKALPKTFNLKIIIDNFYLFVIMIQEFSAEIHISGVGSLFAIQS